MSVKIIQGEDRDITVQLKNGDGSNLDLTPYNLGAPVNSADIKACFVSTGAAIEILESTGGIVVNGDPSCGNITISLSAAQTALLDPDSKDFEIDLLDDSVATKTRIVQLKGVLDVQEQIC